MKNFTPLKGFEDLEASTQMVIEEAQNRKLEIKIIDREKNLIFISKGNKGYYIGVASICEAVSSISDWLSTDKWISKRILLEKGISCVKGILLKKDFLPEAIKKIKFPVVVKPVDTDCGVGISVNIKSKAPLIKAIIYAFEFSNRVIVEDFLDWTEYRFLVIDYKLRAIANRVPANVIGDGKHSISQLIEEKNNSSLRDDNYMAPLLKIHIDTEVERHLIEQKLSLSNIPGKGEKIYLRTNSNLSTGGDSIDVTDDIPDFYKKEAEKAAKILGLKIAGIDIMINNINAQSQLADNYVILEANCEPMLSAHHPCNSNNRNVAKYVLDVLLKCK